MGAKGWAGAHENLPGATHRRAAWPKEDVMRVWTMLGVGALMLAAVVLPSGVWGASIDDVKAEMQKMTPNSGGKLELRIPRAAFGKTRMPIDDLCVSSGRLRPIKESGSDKITDMGPVRSDNKYRVTIVEKLPSATGDEKIRATRTVSIPDCK